MISLLLDTNIIIDAVSAGILEYLNCNMFYISSVVLNEEVLKQVSQLNPILFTILNETPNELILATRFSKDNKRISFYDALNVSISKERNMVLVTGDNRLIEFAKLYDVNCIGTVKLLELMVESKIIDPIKCKDGLIMLRQDNTRRIPIKLIDELIEKIESKYLVA